MDSWTDQQLAIMKAGGNAACAKFLADRGVLPSVSIKAKYDNPAAQLYKEVLKARVAGLPEPTSLPQQPSRASTPSSSSQYTSSNSSNMVKARPGEDPNGMERLTGETDEQYIARQTRIREEARVRMAAKFGGSGGLSGRMGGLGSTSVSSSGNRFGGIGSDPSYDPSRGSYGGGLGGSLDVDNLKSTLVSGFGSAWSSVSTLTAQASQQASSVWNDPSLRTKAPSAAVTDIWSSIASAASRAAAVITEPDSDEYDGLSALQRRIREEKEMRASTNSDAGNNNRYSGFGSEDVFNQGAFSAYRPTESGHDAASVTSSMNVIASAPSSSSSIATNASSNNFYGVANRFSSSATISSAPTSLTGTMDFSRKPSSVASAPTSGQKVVATKLKVEGSSDDFFASFGA